MYTCHRIIFSLLLLYPFSDSFTEAIPVSSYGWLDQYSMDSKHNFVGNEACVPTSSTNALTYLQNAVPFLFGDTLSGSSYADWEATDDYLIAAMGTTAIAGTYYDQFVYAIHQYITQTKGYSEVQFSGIFPGNNWAPPYTQPSYIVSGVPSIPFFFNAIAAGSAILTSIEYLNGGGHEILVNGLNWDSTSQSGTLYFVDPLDPSQNYSPEVPLGPVKQTMGTLELSGDGTRLILSYDQYSGRLPYTRTYDKVEAFLYGVLSIGSAPFAPFSTLLKRGNLHAIAVGFDSIDPTTPEMFPIMAVLNTSVDLQGAFAQLDPSVFDPLLHTAGEAAERIRMALSDHLLSYHTPCGCPASQACFTLWCIPFNTHLSQKGRCNHKGYQSTIAGAAAGIDFPLCRNLIAGAGFSYAKSCVKWERLTAKGDLQNYGGFVYGLWKESPFWLEASFGYTDDRVKAHRHLSLISSVPFVAPIQSTLSHKENTQSYLGHLGGSYEIYKASCRDINLDLRPYLNVDYIYAAQPSFKEKGNAIFAQSISKKKGILLFSEWGVASSLCKTLYGNYNALLHASLSYVCETQYGSKHTHAHFIGQPQSAFTVSGLQTKNHLFHPSIILGVAGPDDLFKLHLAYQGSFGAHFTSNEISAGVSLAF